MADNDSLRDDAKQEGDKTLFDHLVSRLRGVYVVSVNDGGGLLDRKDTFTRTFTGLPRINEEAAKSIELLVSKIPFTKDGQPIGIGDTVYCLDEDGRREVHRQTVNCITANNELHMRDCYAGSHIIGCEEFERGNEDFFSTEQSCRRSIQ